MTPHGSTFIVNQSAGVTVGVYSTLQEAQREVETCAQDDLILKTARSLVKKAVDVLMRMHHIDRRAGARLD
jgi:hypothetical protein